MRKYLLAAAAAAAIASPALARDGSPYIGIEGGAVIDADSDFDLEVDDGVTTTEYDDAFRLDYKTGWDADIIAGYDFGMIRAEGEIGYKRVKIDEIRIGDTLLDDLDAVDDDFDLDDRASVLSGMINVLFDIGDDSGVNFYAGGGAGRARVKLLDDKESAWAWQLIAGVRVPVSESVDVGLKYRYFQTGNLHFRGQFDDGVDVFDLDASGKFKSHSLLASLTFNLGAPAPAAEPAPPPPPPAPPPPAMQTCPDGSQVPADAACPLPPPPPPPPAAGERG